MNTTAVSLLFRAFPAALLTLGLAAFARAEIVTPYDPCANPLLTIRHGTPGKVVVKWHAPAGATQLYWAPSLDNSAAWQPLPGAVPLQGGAWQTEFPIGPPSAYFRVLPAATPVPPPNVRLVMAGDQFRLEWDSTCDALGYSVYIGTSPATGPGNFLQRLPLPMANALEITGLTEGVRYYITIAATNRAGEGLPATAVQGVYGPKVLFSGRAVQSFTLPTGQPFEVEAEGAVITLTLSDGIGYSATVNASGEFRFPDLPPGNYNASYTWNGVAGVFPSRLAILTTGALSSLLKIPAGFPLTPANTLLGTLTLSSGDPPRIAAPQFGLNAKATLTATFADNSTRTVTPDAHGAWAITQITGGFPVTLTANYQDLTTTWTVTSPPAALAVEHTHFIPPLPEPGRLIITQEGIEAETISPGVPVTFAPEFTDPPSAPLKQKWTIEYDGKMIYDTRPAPQLTFGGPGGLPVGPEGGRVQVRLATTDYTLQGGGTYVFYIDPPDLAPPGQGCWTGVTGTWNPAAPNDILPASNAQITIHHSAPGIPVSVSSAPNQNGVTWFDAAIDPVKAAPYLLRVHRQDHMRFLWPFEFRLPNEATFCVVPAVISNHTQTSGNILQVNGPSDSGLAIPYGSLRKADNTIWTGAIRVSMVAWNPLVRSPLPPGVEIRSGGLRRAFTAWSGVWFDITTDTGESLTPDSDAALFLPGAFAPNSIPVAHQIESTGYFERAGNAVRLDAARYGVALGSKGTYLMGPESDLMEPVVAADRSINYPFDVLVNTSIFPVTVTGPGEHTLGHFYMPRSQPFAVRVLDLLQAPGLHYVTPAHASATRPLEPVKKKVIATAESQLIAPVAALPAITPVKIHLSLGDTEPSLKDRGTDFTVKAIEPDTTFLARAESSKADAAAYYQKIAAPATLAEWRALNGFPANFGGPLPGVGMDKFTRAYYYNLGDLGFARAQTMRITTGSDGQPDVAFAVTNYPNLEAAHCRRTPIATVAMDFALRKDRGENTPSRYTRFYVYGSTGALLDCADLDGSGRVKCVPNLCVICHGGKPYQAGGSTNLGSRFLPFDLASYAFHPRFGVQKEEIAAMNAGVLQTQTTAAIADLIQGWYGSANPATAAANFQQNYVPVTGVNSWDGQTALYNDMFKHSCRVCHISREGRLQFSSYASLEKVIFGHESVCSGINMPNSQRTWGVFWGSRTANKLGAAGIPDMPTILGNAAGLPCRTTPPP